MRRIFGLIVLLYPFTDFLLAQSPLTVISDTIIYSNGTRPSGSATLSWGRSLDDSTPRKIIYPGSKVITITNGVVLTSLFPNTVMLPVGTCVSVAYNLGGVKSTRYWSVPVSPTPVNLNTVEGSLPCPTQSGVLIAPGQIAGGNATVGQALLWNGYFWSPGTVSGSGGGTPSGTNGQLQYNNLGAFGGFTVAGDCVLNRPNFICTKTNGVSFAPSATIDTTNGSNIASGVIGVGVGGTGTSTAFTAGSLVFAGSGGAYLQDNVNLFYNSSLHRLAIGIGGAPLASLDVESGGNDLTSPGIIIRASDSVTNQGYLLLNKNSGSSTAALIQAGDGGNFQELKLNPSGGKVTVGSTLAVYSSTGTVAVGGLADAGYRLDVQNSGSSGTMRIFDQTLVTGSTALVMKAGVAQLITPLITFQDNTGAQISQIGADGSFASIGGGVRTALFFNNTVGLGSAGVLQFNNALGWDGGAVDAGVGRNGIGIVEINSGTLGAFRDLKARNITATALGGLGSQCASVDNNGQFVIAGTGPCFAGSSITPYSQTVTTQTAVTILAATHARGVTPIATCLDNSTPKNVVICAYSRNVSGNLVFAFNPSFSGTIEVRQ